MTNYTSDAAVAAALASNWKKAIEINSALLKDTPLDIACLNRLGRAYLELGNCKKAIEYFKKVLKISKYDPIATKNLARAQVAITAKPNGQLTSNHTFTLVQKISFLEEPGQTKLVSLVNVAPAKTLLHVNYADPVKISCRRHTIMVTDFSGNYLGAFPDDLGHRLLVLVKGGNTYEGFVKGVSKNQVTIFVREVTRAKKFKNTPSFPTSVSDYLSFVREDSPVLDESKPTPDSDSDSDSDEDTPKPNRFSDELTEEES